MYTAEVKFKITQKQNREKQADLIYSLCGSWHMNGQMLNRHFPIAENSDDFTLYVNKYLSSALLFVRRVYKEEEKWLL